jgi:hemoglobin/transferrin/lactoferrin receptor protein
MVTVSRVLQDLMDVPMGVSVLTAEDLEREPYTNITEALTQLPGVMIDTLGRPGASRVSIRGESYGRTLILIDGVKAVDKDGSDNTITIDPSQIERIEIIKGPGSVLYGTDGMGGVISIITKRGGNKPVGFSQNFIFDSSTRSVEPQTAVFGRYNGFNYRVSASGVNAKDRRVPGGSRDGGTAASSSYRNRYYSAQFGYDWDGHSFTLRADHYENKSFYAQGLSAVQDKTIMRLDPNDRDTVTASLTLSALTERLRKLTFTASYQRIQKDFISDFNNPALAFAGMWAVGHGISDQRQLTFSAQAEWSLGRHYLTAGVDYIGDDVKVRAETYPYNPVPPTFSAAKVKRQTLDLFAQDEWSVTDGLTLTGGLRFSTVRDSMAYQHGPHYPAGTFPKKKASKLVGSLGAVYRGIPDWAFRFNYTMGYRYPSIRQLLTGSTGHGGPSMMMLANPDLKPETSHNFEIGARHQSDHWEVDVSLFLSNAKNYIHWVTVSGGFMNPPWLARYYNMNKARTYGAEVSVAYSFEAADFKFTPYGKGTWLKRRLTLPDGRSSADTNTPPFEGRVGLKFERQLGGAALFYGDLYANMAAKTDYNISDGTFNGSLPPLAAATTRAEAWQTLNLTLGVRGGEDHKYNVSLSLRNLFDQTYRLTRSDESINEPGFSAVLAIGYEY